MLNKFSLLQNHESQIGCTILEAGWEEFCLVYESVETQNRRHMPHGELVLGQAEQDALQRIQEQACALSSSKICVQKMRRVL